MRKIDIMLRLLRFFADNHISDAAARSWAKYFWPTALVAQISGKVPFRAQKSAFAERDDDYWPSAMHRRTAQ